ncbi:hypothetical protein BRC96_04655 [Halobacteriales archaeon QS_6_64_34]|nr:MAG: hypothetical protein BRC96_04655 [Halobacteriales archaeon QS_6_64_34]
MSRRTAAAGKTLATCQTGRKRHRNGRPADEECVRNRARIGKLHDIRGVSDATDEQAATIEEVSRTVQRLTE